MTKRELYYHEYDVDPGQSVDHDDLVDEIDLGSTTLLRYKEDDYA